jgi:hypothetical protein
MWSRSLGPVISPDWNGQEFRDLGVTSGSLATDRDPEEASPALVLTMSGDTRLVCCAMGLRQPDKSRTSVRSARTRTLVRFRVIAANSTMRVLFP